MQHRRHHPSLTSWPASRGNNNGVHASQEPVEPMVPRLRGQGSWVCRRERGTPDRFGLEENEIMSNVPFCPALVPLCPFPGLSWCTWRVRPSREQGCLRSACRIACMAQSSCRRYLCSLVGWVWLCCERRTVPGGLEVCRAGAYLTNFASCNIVSQLSEDLLCAFSR
jgi:hypothetical protein